MRFDRLPLQGGGQIIGESEIRRISDPMLRHQVLLLFAQNRSYHNQLNLMKQAGTDKPIDVAVEPALTKAADLILTEGEIEAIRDFIDPRKLRARHLSKTNQGAVTTKDGRTIADPGFVLALEKIAKSHERGI